MDLCTQQTEPWVKELCQENEGLILEKKPRQWLHLHTCSKQTLVHSLVKVVLTNEGFT